MKLKRRHKEGAEVSTESLNDIMFFLLLFFLIISTLANPNVIKLNLPNSKQSDQQPAQQVVLEVTADNQYLINKTPVPLAQLEDAIKTELARTNSKTVLLRLDKSLTIQDLADVMQIGYGLQVKMVLATKLIGK
ncbi:MAG: biopolymer transporter ExbD [Bacteroidetes bacterium]|nr:biopolymer transporter ExbD [Bacteroidota bacterium]